MGKNRHKSRLIKLAAASLASLTLLGMGTGIHAASVNKAAVSHPNIVATQPKASRHTAVRASKVNQKPVQASGQQKAQAIPTASQDNTGKAADGKAQNAGQKQAGNQQGQKQNGQSKQAQAALTAQNNANAQPAESLIKAEKEPLGLIPGGSFCVLRKSPAELPAGLVFYFTGAC